MSPTQTYLFHSFLAALTVIAILFSVFAISLFYHIHKKRIQLREKLFQDECLIEADKARIAKDLHDDLGSLLTGLKFSFTALAEKDGGDTFLASSVQQIDGSILRLREISLNLLPRELQTEGLNAAIESFIERIHLVDCIEIQYSGVGEVDQMDPQKAMILFRVLQEMITNSIKHSKASLIRIGIALQLPSFIVEIHDNGIGFDYESCLRLKHRSGLKNIQSRLEMLKATLFVESSKGSGTHYFITIPYRQVIHGNHH